MSAGYRNYRFGYGVPAVAVHTNFKRAPKIAALDSENESDEEAYDEARVRDRLGADPATYELNVLNRVRELELREQGLAHYTEQNILNGSFGNRLDALLGTHILGTRHGSVLQKYHYTANAPSSDTGIAYFTLDKTFEGEIYGWNGSTITASTTLVDVTKVASQRLKSGDVLLGAILIGQSTSDRNSNDGSLIAGHVPLISGTKVASDTLYGLLNSTNVASTIMVSASQGAVDVAAQHQMKIAACTTNLAETLCERDVATSGERSRMTLAVGYDGIANASNAQSMKFDLFVYALSVPTIEQLSTVSVRHSNVHISELESFVYPATVVARR